MIRIIKPGHPLLDRYIDCYYSSPAGQGAISYVAFPHVNRCLSFFRNCTLSTTKDEIYIRPEYQNNRVCAFVTGIYNTPAYVNYTGAVEEIAIIFKPMGMSRFFENYAQYSVAGLGQELLNGIWIEAGSTIIEEQTEDRIRTKLNEWLLSQLNDEDMHEVEEAIRIWEENDLLLSVDELARKLHMHRKTIERYFIQAVSCPPNTYRRIAQFRKSIKIALLSEEIKQLTKVAYDSNYYDQSYFIREYRKLTGNNPRDFFRRLTAYEQNEIIWALR